MRVEAETKLLKDENETSFVERLNLEIRRAANSFLGITELLLDTKLTREQREYVDVLRSATDRLLSIGGRIVRVSGGDSEYEPCSVQFDLRELVEQTACLMGILGAETGVQILTEIAGNPRWPVTGDRRRLEEVLVSVLSGFMKSASSTCIRIVVLRAEAGAIRFEIIKPCKTPADLEMSGDSQAELSIAVAAQTVNSMGGFFAISASDQRITCSCTIPLADATDEKPAKAHKPAPLQKGSPDSVRVLLAEDSPDNQFTIRAYLKNQPYTINIVDSGTAAVHEAKSGQYSIILMDIEMPGMSGIEATKAIREWEEKEGRQPIPVIALTAHSSTDDMNTCLAEGFTAYLSKPVRKQMVLETLQRYLPGER